MKKLQFPRGSKKRLVKQNSFRAIFMRKGLPQTLFSTQRIQSFGGIRAYQSHIDFTQELIPLIQNIELILRNKINSIMSSHSSTWLIDLYCYKLITPKKKWQKKEQKEMIGKIEKTIDSVCEKQKITDKSHSSLIKIQDLNDIILSQMTCGFWMRLMCSQNFSSFSLFTKIFPKLSVNISQDNINFLNFLDEKSQFNIDEMNYSDIDKCLIFIAFVGSIRNRTLHWENLLKFTQSPDGEYSSITIKYYIKNKKIYLSFNARKKKILKFLEMILEELITPKRGRPSVRTSKQQNYISTKLNICLKSKKERK